VRVISKNLLVLKNSSSSLFTFFAKHAIVFFELNANIILTVLLNWQMFERAAE
jgi:hypothetical protein